MRDSEAYVSPNDKLAVEDYPYRTTCHRNDDAWFILDQIFILWPKYEEWEVMFTIFSKDILDLRERVPDSPESPDVDDDDDDSDDDDQTHLPAVSFWRSSRNASLLISEEHASEERDKQLGTGVVTRLLLMPDESRDIRKALDVSKETCVALYTRFFSLPQFAVLANGASESEGGTHAGVVWIGRYVTRHWPAEYTQDCFLRLGRLCQESMERDVQQPQV